MYKGKLKDGDLDAFSDEEIESMKAEIEEKKADIKRLYKVSNTVKL